MYCNVENINSYIFCFQLSRNVYVHYDELIDFPTIARMKFFTIEHMQHQYASFPVMFVALALMSNVNVICFVFSFHFF